MPPKGHAILSACSSDRWLHCPPSARLCETYEDKGSNYAAEGTDAHELCEYKLKTDCIIIADGTLRICDYKHGLGVLVDATDNPQMKCYALGALELFDDIYDIDNVSMTIYQPRRQNISTLEISKDELYKWADEVLKPTADLAFAGDGNFLCGE